MKIYLFRHGETRWNREKRYQGVSDIPLSPEGQAALIPAGFTPEVVYVSSLHRTHQTAEKLFPKVPQIIVDDLREMDFGAFEGRNYMEMEHDAAYRTWVEGNCEGRCPGGEDWVQFSSRVKRAFLQLVEAHLERQEKNLVIVAHGGVQMALMESFALPRKDRYQWFVQPGGGFLLELEENLWRTENKLRYLDTVRCTREEELC